MLADKRFLPHLPGPMNKRQSQYIFPAVTGPQQVSLALSSGEGVPGPPGSCAHRRLPNHCSPRLPYSGLFCALRCSRPPINTDTPASFRPAFLPMAHLPPGFSSDTRRRDLKCTGCRSTAGSCFCSTSDSPCLCFVKTACTDSNAP